MWIADSRLAGFQIFEDGSPSSNADVVVPANDLSDLDFDEENPGPSHDDTMGASLAEPSKSGNVEVSRAEGSSQGSDSTLRPSEPDHDALNSSSSSFPETSPPSSPPNQSILRFIPQMYSAGHQCASPGFTRSEQSASVTDSPQTDSHTENVTASESRGHQSEQARHSRAGAESSVGQEKMFKTKPMLGKRDREEEVTEITSEETPNPPKRHKSTALISTARPGLQDHKIKLEPQANASPDFTLQSPTRAGDSRETAIVIDDLDSPEEGPNPMPTADDPSAAHATENIEALDTKLQAIGVPRADDHQRLYQRHSLQAPPNVTCDVRPAISPSTSIQQSESSAPQQMSGRQTFAVYHDTQTGGDPYQSHPAMSHLKSNALDARPQNQNNIPPQKMFYPEVPSQLGKRGSDEAGQHMSRDGEPVFKKPFLPATYLTRLQNGSSAPQFDQISSYTPQSPKQPAIESQPPPSPSLPPLPENQSLGEYLNSKPKMPVHGVGSLNGPFHPLDTRVQRQPLQGLDTSRPYGAVVNGSVPSAYRPLPGFDASTLFMPPAGHTYPPPPSNLARQLAQVGGSNDDSPMGRLHAAHNKLQCALFDHDDNIMDPEMIPLFSKTWRKDQRVARERDLDPRSSQVPGAHQLQASPTTAPLNIEQVDANQRPPSPPAKAGAESGDILRAADKGVQPSGGPVEESDSAANPAQEGQGTNAGQRSSANDMLAQPPQGANTSGQSQLHPHPNQNNSPQLAPPPPVQQPTINYRELPPRNEREKLHIVNAISHSHVYFQQILKFKPQGTYTADSFAQQYEQLQDEYRENLGEGMNPALYEPFGRWRAGHHGKSSILLFHC